MSNDLSPRAVCSTTIGISGTGASFSYIATLWLQIKIANVQLLGCAWTDANEKEAAMTDCIERELVLPASAAEVWDVITSNGWLAEQVELNLVPGGDARFTNGEDVRTGWVEEADAPQPGRESARLAFWWSAGDEAATRVELLLEAEDELLTRLRVIETRPLEVLDVIGIPLPGSGSAPESGGAFHGPALVVA
jgi:hypothetical protein